MSGLIEDLHDSFTLKSDCHRIGIRVNDIYVNLSRENGQLIISTHPIGKEIEDNCFKKIQTPLYKKNIIDNYPTLKQQED